MLRLFIRGRPSISQDGLFSISADPPCPLFPSVPLLSCSRAPRLHSAQGLRGQATGRAPPPCYCPAVVLLAFTLPKGYEAKQQDVDRLLGAASAKAKELYAKVDEVVFKKVAAKKTQ